MLLVIDIGNTNITVGIYKDDKIIKIFRLTTEYQRTSDDYGLSLLTFLQADNIAVEDIDDVIISSVVPKINYSFNNSIKKYFHKTPISVGPGVKTGIDIRIDNPSALGADRLVDAVGAFYTYGGPCLIFHKTPISVGPGVKTGIDIRIDNPSALGADRLVDAVGAFYTYGGPCLIVDFGTATTYDIVSSKGEFIGGVIAPGIGICAHALSSQTAKLPEVEIEKPDKIIAKNTIKSMQAGIVYGYIGQTEYIIRKIKEEYGQDLKVISTGGLGRIIANETDLIDIYDVQLTFKGLKIIYDKTKGAK